MTPSLAGYTFTPAVRNHPNVGWGETGQNFTATATGSTGTVFYIHADHLNTPRLITNGAGQAVWRWDQADPFGGNVPNENPSGLGTFTCNLRLPGQYFDKETNLHYNMARDYDPTIGRYAQSDPIGLRGGINTYAYVEGNPLRFIDPWGLATCFNQQDCLDQASHNLTVCTRDLNVGIICALGTACAAVAKNPIAFSICILRAAASCAGAGAACINQFLSNSKACRDGNPITGYMPTDNYSLAPDDDCKCYSEPDFRKFGKR